jgi:hypothetical protein
VLFKSFCFSFVFAFFQWFFAAADGCGFSSFPTFGLQAFDQRFNSNYFKAMHANILSAFSNKCY